MAAGDWQLYRERFLRDEGRLVDDGNGGITHSEGQGYAMLLAEAHGDRVAFERTWNWTRDNLQARDDRLFAWRWLPGTGVADFNNASDGDILIAWALARAADRWGRKDYRLAAEEICREVRETLLMESAQGLVLLPGTWGFERTESLVVNPGYWVYPAFAKFDEIDPSPEWQELTDSGLTLLRLGRFGRWQLPPDWLQVEPSLEVATDVGLNPGPLFGYDAVRVPLYLVWGGYGDRHRLHPFLSYWEHFEGASFIAPWTNLYDNSIASYDASQGIHAIVALSREAAGLEPGARLILGEQEDYYSSSLVLLARLARQEGLKS